MPAATLTAKGQITIPRKIRTRLNLKTGDKLNFEIKTGVITATPVSGKIAAAFGVLSRNRLVKPVTIRELNERLEDAFRTGKI